MAWSSSESIIVSRLLVSAENDVVITHHDNPMVVPFLVFRHGEDVSDEAKIDSLRVDYMEQRHGTA